MISIDFRFWFTSHSAVAILFFVALLNLQYQAW